MRAFVTIGAAVAVLAASVPEAQATLALVITPGTVTSSGGLTTSFVGAETVTFDQGDTLPAGFAGGTVVRGTTGAYAAPSGDTSNYFSVGTAPTYTGSATFSPGGTYDYFGLYWGSVDRYNTITFTLGGVTTGTVKGSDLPPATGDKTAADTNIYLDVLFSDGSSYDMVTFTTTTPNFELDNVAFGRVAIPEPTSLVMFGASLVALAGYRARRHRNPCERAVA